MKTKISLILCLLVTIGATLLIALKSNETPLQKHLREKFSIKAEKNITADFDNREKIIAETDKFYGENAICLENDLRFYSYHLLAILKDKKLQKVALELRKTFPKMPFTARNLVIFQKCQDQKNLKNMLVMAKYLQSDPKVVVTLKNAPIYAGILQTSYQSEKDIKGVLKFKKKFNLKFRYPDNNGQYSSTYSDKKHQFTVKDFYWNSFYYLQECRHSPVMRHICEMKLLGTKIQDFGSEPRQLMERMENAGTVQSITRLLEISETLDIDIYVSRSIVALITNDDLYYRVIDITKKIVKDPRWEEYLKTTKNRPTSTKRVKIADNFSYLNDFLRTAITTEKTLSYEMRTMPYLEIKIPIKPGLTDDELVELSFTMLITFSKKWGEYIQSQKDRIEKVVDIDKALTKGEKPKGLTEQDLKMYHLIKECFEDYHNIFNKILRYGKKYKLEDYERLQKLEKLFKKYTKEYGKSPVEEFHFSLWCLEYFEKDPLLPVIVKLIFWGGVRENALTSAKNTHKDTFLSIHVNRLIMGGKFDLYGKMRKKYLDKSIPASEVICKYWAEMTEKERANLVTLLTNLDNKGVKICYSVHLQDGRIIFLSYMPWVFLTHLEKPTWQVSDPFIQTLEEYRKKVGRKILQSEVGLIHHLSKKPVEKKAFLETDFNELRKNLTTDLSKERHLFRSDIEGSTYDEHYNQIEKKVFNEGELWKIRKVYNFLKDKNNQVAILKKLRSDLKDESGEFGGLLEDNSFNYYKSVKQDDGRWGMTKEVLHKAPKAISTFHCHATKTVISNLAYAGPSKGDLANAKQMKLDGFVFTLIDENAFNLDFYSSRGKVLDIKLYKVDTKK